MIPPEFPIDQKVMYDAIHNGGYIECFQLHPGSCESRFPVCFLRTIKTMSRYYLPIHIIPFLLFKRKKVRENPYEEITKALKSYINSLLYACTTTGIVSIILCYVRRLEHKINGDIGLPISAILSSPAILFQSEGRRREISLFLVPKVMEIVYNLLKRRGMVNRVPNFTALAFGVAMAILCLFYMVEGKTIHPTILLAFKQILGEEV